MTILDATDGGIPTPTTHTCLGPQATTQTSAADADPAAAARQTCTRYRNHDDCIWLWYEATVERDCEAPRSRDDIPLAVAPILTCITEAEAAATQAFRKANVTQAAAARAKFEADQRAATAAAVTAADMAAAHATDAAAKRPMPSTLRHRGA